MKEGVCPFCRADIRFQCCRLSSLVGIIEIEYFCGTIKDADDYHQAGECKDRQIAALQAALAEKEERWKAWGDFRHLFGLPEWEMVLKKLKDLGEIS